MSKPATTVLRRKLVIVGDSFCGKTSLFEVFTKGNFPTHDLPTVFESYVTDCRVDGKSVQLALWDTAGQEDYDRLRPLVYVKAHVIIIGFSIGSTDSFENATHKWAEEVAEKCAEAQTILVGLKKDLREDANTVEALRTNELKFVQAKDAAVWARTIKARKYLECSSLTGEGVDDVFEAAARAAMEGSQVDGKDSGGCCILL